MFGGLFSWSTRRSEGIASAKLITDDRGGAETVCASLGVGDAGRVCVVDIFESGATEAATRRLWEGRGTGLARTFREEAR